MTGQAQIRLSGGVLGTIEPEIYGQFLSRRRWVADEALFHPAHQDAGDDGLRRAVVDAIAELESPIVRWPGGCTGTSYEWQRGVGPERSRTIDWHFGYDVGNGFGTAEFVDYCRRIGAAPQINLTTGTGDLREAMAWVEYCNGTGQTPWAQLRRDHGYEEPFAVRHWQIGNEEWGPWEQGYTTAEANAARVREWAKAIKRFDPELTVLGVGAFDPSGAIDWNLPLLREAWEHIDFLTLHTYWHFDPEAADGDYARVLSGPVRTEASIQAIQGLVDLVARERADGGRGPRLAFTEWNCVDATRFEMSPAWRPADTQYRLVDALAVASFIHVMQRQCRSVGLANFAQTINVVGALLVTEDAVVRETVYWALQMLRRNSGSVALDAVVSCDAVPGETLAREATQIPALDVSVTTDPGTSRAWVSVVNRDVEPVNVRIDLGRVLLERELTLHQLTHEDPLARNTLAGPETVVPRVLSQRLGEDDTLTLPPHSITIAQVQTDDVLVETGATIGVP